MDFELFWSEIGNGFYPFWSESIRSAFARLPSFFSLNVRTLPKLIGWNLKLIQLIDSQETCFFRQEKKKTWNCFIVTEMFDRRRWLFWETMTRWSQNHQAQDFTTSKELLTSRQSKTIQVIYRPAACQKPDALKAKEQPLLATRLSLTTV